jgi:hypothetical protein
MLPNSWGGPPGPALRPAVQGDRPTIYSGHRSGLFKWHWALSPAIRYPQLSTMLLRMA